MARGGSSPSLEHVGHVRWAEDLARRLLAEPLPQRWAHTQGVGAKADTVSRAVAADADLLVCAAWLHDVGYSPALATTGFHPLDGARYLRDVESADVRLVRLVANHSCALIEARHRGLAGALTAEFPTPDDLVLDALTYCDMTTSPGGAPVDIEQRLAEASDRYGEDHLVSRSLAEARPSILASAARVTAALAG